MEKDTHVGRPWKRPYHSPADVFLCKWNTCLLLHLADAPLRHSVLKKRLAGIPMKVFNERLQRLQATGLISRTAFPGYPLHVRYTLTPKGQHFAAFLRAMDAVTTSKAVSAEILGCKWIVGILAQLEIQARSPSVLRHLLDGITSKVLFDRLQALQQWEVIHRVVASGQPRRVHYALTDKGQQLCRLLAFLSRQAHA